MTNNKNTIILKKRFPVRMRVMNLVVSGSISDIVPSHLILTLTDVIFALDLRSRSNVCLIGTILAVAGQYRLLTLTTGS